MTNLVLGGRLGLCSIALLFGLIACSSNNDGGAGANTGGAGNGSGGNGVGQMGGSNGGSATGGGAGMPTATGGQSNPGGMGGSAALTGGAPNAGGNAMTAGGNDAGGNSMTNGGADNMGGGNESQMSDEFDGDVDLLANNTSDWQVLHADRASRIEIGDGQLVVVGRPPSAGQSGWGWFQDNYGPLVYREVTGNFAVATRLRVVDDLAPQSRPTGGFNAGGFVIRDASGTHNNNENWLMYNMGSQGMTGYSREIKKTRMSQSGLYLNPQAFEEAALLVCRIGDAFHFFRWNGADSRWDAERFIPGTTENAARAWPEVDTSGTNAMVFNHDTIADTVQVGVMAHSYNAAGNNDQSGTRGVFEYVRFAAEPPQSAAGCTSAFSSVD